MAKYSESELNKCSKKMLIDLLMSMQDQMDMMNRNIELLTEQIRIANQKKFGRSSEKMEYDGQLTFKDVFNEAEFHNGENLLTFEPEFEEIIPKSYKRKKRKGKRDEDLSGIETIEIRHELNEEQLNEIFGENGWKQLPDEVYKRLTFHPAEFKVEEHHVAVYAGKDNETIVKGDRPADVLRNSILTPSLGLP